MASNMRIRVLAVSMMAGGLFIAGALAVTAAESKNDQLKLTTNRVVVFKDGYYLALKSGTSVTNKDGEVILNDVPDAAVLGSVWATSTKGKLIGMVASREAVKQTAEKIAPCSQPIEILEANIGKKAKILMQDKTTYDGEILKVLTEPTVTASTPALSHLLDAEDADSLTGLNAARSRSVGIPSVTISGISGSQFILRTDEGDSLLNVSQIQLLTVKEMKTSIARIVTTTSSPKRLTFRFAEPDKAVDISFMYFQPGLRWIPTYRINLSAERDKKSANVDLQAEFLNEAEDLDNVPVDIVVGVPNFRFRDTPSPLILEQTLRNVLQQAAPQLMGQQMSNASFTSRSGERFNGQAENAVPLNLPAELGAVGAQDLFVYTIKNLKLMKGQRAAMPLVTARVPYRDVYTWDVHLTRRDVETPGGISGMMPGTAGAGPKASPLALSENRVWHQIVLSNTTHIPWTTGAALLMQGDQPLAQDLLTYTSVGSEARIPVTVSVDSQGTYSEEETARKLNALSFEGYNFARIDKLVTLNLINHKSTPIDVEISFRTGGKAEEATHDGKMTLNSHSPADWIDYRGQSAVNNSSRVIWTATVKPGERFSPSVKYYIFARH